MRLSRHASASGVCQLSQPGNLAEVLAGDVLQARAITDALHVRPSAIVATDCHTGMMKSGSSSNSFRLHPYFMMGSILRPSPQVSCAWGAPLLDLTRLLQVDDGGRPGHALRAFQIYPPPGARTPSASRTGRMMSGHFGGGCGGCCHGRGGGGSREARPHDGEGVRQTCSQPARAAGETQHPGLEALEVLRLHAHSSIHATRCTRASQSPRLGDWNRAGPPGPSLREKISLRETLSRPPSSARSAGRRKEGSV